MTRKARPNGSTFSCWMRAERVLLDARDRIRGTPGAAPGRQTDRATGSSLSFSAERVAVDESSDEPAELRPQRRQLVGNLERGASRRALFQHRHRHRRHARSCGIVGCKAGIDQQRQPDNRHGLASRQHHLQAVGQRGAIDGRQRGIWRRANARQGLAIGVGRRGGECGKWVYSRT